MKLKGLAAAIVVSAGIAAAPAWADSTMITPSWSPLSVDDAFFGGAFFGGGGDGRNAFPWTAPGPRTQGSLGCYFTRTRVDNAWRRVEVCY